MCEVTWSIWFMICIRSDKKDCASFEQVSLWLTWNVATVSFICFFFATTAKKKFTFISCHFAPLLSICNLCCLWIKVCKSICTLVLLMIQVTNYFCHYASQIFFSSFLLKIVSLIFWCKSVRVKLVTDIGHFERLKSG